MSAVESLSGLAAAVVCGAWLLEVPAGAAAPPPARYAAPMRLAVLQDPEIIESSGLDLCLSVPDAFWTHNDSSDTSRLFLVDRSGRTLARLAVVGADACDWEAMASFRVGAENYLLVGDIGANDRRRTELTLYLIREPDMASAGAGGFTRVLWCRPQAVIRFRYAGGPHDCEALAVDVGARKILLATKSLLLPSSIYELPLVLESPTSPLVARRIGLVDIPLVTGMDISDDGRRAVIVSYLAAYEFVRRPREPWDAAFARRPQLLEAPRRRQGEAICYGHDGRSLYLTSEGKSQPLWCMPARDRPAP